MVGQFDKLALIDCKPTADVGGIVAALACDQVALLRGISPEVADEVVLAVAAHFGLEEQLRAQAAFAAVLRHRSNVGRFFMTVNQREDFQFISSHSEGVRSANIQLGAMYCYENTTDGGESIFQNTDSESDQWRLLRECVQKLDLCGRTLTATEIAKARAVHKVRIPEDLVQKTDDVIGERKGPFEGTRMFDVLVNSEPIESLILGRRVHVLWDNLTGVDQSMSPWFANALRARGLLREPDGPFDVSTLDALHQRRRWSSGANYDGLFKNLIVRKLAHDELMIFNNTTWTHGTANWTPGSGVRNVAVAFA